MKMLLHRWTDGQWEVLEGSGTDKIYSAGWMDPNGNALALGGTLDPSCSCSMTSVNKMDDILVQEEVFTLTRKNE